MTTLQTISLVVIAISTMVIAMFLLFIMTGIFGAVRSANEMLKELKEEFSPLARQITETARRANEVAERIVEEADGFTRTVSSVRRRTERLGALVEVLEDNLENTTVKIFSVLGSLVRSSRGRKRSRKRGSRRGTGESRPREEVEDDE